LQIGQRLIFLGMTGWPKYYVLVGRLPVAVDLMTWANWWGPNRDKCQIGCDEFPGCMISTVFLGLDHNFMGTEPILFETMIFGGPLDGEQWRYSTYSQAERGHKEAVAQAKIAAAKIKSIADKAGAT